MRWFSWSRFLSALALTAMVTACGAGMKNFRRANKLRTEGKLVEARTAYEDALRAEPGNTKYKQALDSLESDVDERVADLVAEAKAEKRKKNWAGASEKYGAASRLKPKDNDLVAHKELSALKAKNLDRDGWYRGLDELDGRVPNNKIIQRSLAGAKAAAYQHHVDQAEALLITGQGKKAYDEFELAKGIEPTLPGIDQDKYRHAEALHLAEQAELRMTTGEPVEAYELYRKAYAKKELPEIKVAMARAKAKASRILNTLEKARSRAKAGRWRQSLALYEQLSSLKGVPASVTEEKARVREKVVEQFADSATRNAKRNRLSRARKDVQGALRIAELESNAEKAVSAAVDAAVKGEGGDAMKALKISGLAETNPLRRAVEAMALVSAKNTYKKAKRIARRDAGKALKMLSGLSPFSKQMPEIKALRRELLKSNFAAMLDEALRQAKRGNDTEAADVLLTALSASKAPAKMRDPAEQACKDLKAKKYVDAERGFQSALTEAPRSRLAQRGVDIARLRRTAAEREAVALLRNGTGDVEWAVDLLESIRKVDPRNSNVKTAATLLADRASSQSSSLDDLKLAKMLGLAARLEEISDGVRGSIESGNGELAQGNYRPAEAAFRKAVAEAPGSKVASLGQRLSRDRMLQALKSGAAKVGEGDEESAKALAELLKTDPNNADAKAAVNALLDKAESAAKAGDDAGAAQFLKLGTIATSPAPGVKDALDKATAALAEGKMIDAEKHFSDATDLEAEHPVATVGYRIAQSARVAGLKSAVAAAKSGQDLERVRAELQRTLEVDPNSKEAREAFSELLTVAKERGEQGDDRGAAGLLDSANVVSKPAKAKEAIGKANKLLEEGKHKEAQTAYETVLKTGQSQVALTGKDVAEARIIQILVAGAAELEKGGDLDRGAKATKELLSIDATHQKGRDAIEAATAAAEKASESGDAKRAAALLHAVAIASDAPADVRKAIDMLGSGRNEDAEKAFGGIDGDLAKRGAAMARARYMAKLQDGMGGDDVTAAKSIREMLAADPNNAQAQAAFQKLLTEAKSAGRQQKDRDAANKLSAALVASGAPDELAEAVKNGITHLGEERHADAEHAFSTALELSGESQVAKTGHEVSQARRRQSQTKALKSIASGDPMPHAKILASSLLVDPESAEVKRALTKLLSRAKTAAKKADDPQTARMLDAAVLLEGLPAATVQAVTDADAQLAASKFADAYLAYGVVNEGEEGQKSEVANLGRQLAHERRIAVLRDDLRSAEKANDVLTASGVVDKILAIDPDDRAAKAAQKKYGKLVLSKRLEAAAAQKKLGKLGAAHLYLRRVLAVDAGNSKALAEKQAIEDELAKRTELIVLVEEVKRNSSIAAHQCKGVEGLLRSQLIDKGAANQDLGAYILSADWVAAVQAGEAGAPKVGGGLVVMIDECTSSSSGGKAKLTWKLVAPRDGKQVAGGTVTGEVPSGALPRDEQSLDNAHKALSRYASKAVLGGVESERGPINAWLLTLAEHWVEKGDAALAADAYARLLIRKPGSYSPKRAEAVETFLNDKFK